MSLEVQHGFLEPQFVDSREQYYVSRDGIVFLGCADDREITPKSAATLAKLYPDARNPLEGYASIYGGAAGIVKVGLVSGIAQFGASFSEKVGGFYGLMDQFKQFLRADTSKDATIPALHTTEDIERQAAEATGENIDPSIAVCTKGDASIGCAYCMGIGATADLLGNNQTIRNIARNALQVVYGDDAFHSEIANANGVVAQELGSDFTIGRQKLAELTNPNEDGHFALMVLAGHAHIAARKSGVISNYDLHTIRDTTAAHNAGLDFYSQDVAIATQLTLRAFKNYNLNPEIVMRAFEMDAIPVRAVLASVDSDPELQGQLNPDALGMAVRGDWQTTLKNLQ